MKKIIIPILLLMFFFSACTSSKTIDNAETYLTGNNWYLKKIHTGGTVTEVTGNIANLKFDVEKRSAGGKGGCNSYGTRYTVKENSIDFKDLFSTKMFCEKYQEIENKYFNNLEKVNKYDVQDNKLLLFLNDELLLEFGK